MEQKSAESLTLSWALYKCIQIIIYVGISLCDI